MRFGNSVWFDKCLELKYLDIVQSLLEFKKGFWNSIWHTPIFLNRSKQTRNEKDMGSKSKGV